MSRRTRVVVTSTALAAALLVTAAAASAQKTIGWTSPTTPTTAYCQNSPFDAIQAKVADPAVNYAVPASGVITSWSTNAWSGANQQLTFKVFRPSGNGAYTVVGADLRPLTPSALNTFKVSIPVQAGDVIGTEDTNATEYPTACGIETGDPGDEVTSEFGGVAVGGSEEFFIPEEELLLNVSATVLTAPTIASLGTTSDPTAGGTLVVISGSEFAEVQSVRFGTTATAYSVNSEAQITATAPAGAVGKVPVTVTTAAGTATSAQTYAYTACVVPKLKGKKLKAAKKALRKASCKVGHVGRKKGVTAKSGKVVAQKPKPGTVRTVGAKVGVKLG